MLCLRGLDISLKTLGPAYRIVCRQIEQPSSISEERSDEGGRAMGDGVKGDGAKVLAVTSGFVVPPPFALMHCDMLQVFTKG